MKQVVYVDILFILNFLITYLLLLTTMKLMKSDEKRWRLLLGAAVGGAYSMIILVPNMHFLLSAVLKVASAAVIILISFKIMTWKRYLKSVLFFFAASIIFVGIMIALWFTSKPNGMIINNSSVYFDIDAKVLILSALAAYIISSVVIKIHNKTAAKNQLYDVTVHNRGLEKTFRAFVDSGNKLREPFSNTPAVIVDGKLMSEMFDEEKMRVIPYHTIGGDGILNAFKPEWIVVSSGSGKQKIDNVYVALSDEKFKNGDFDGVINPDLLNI